MKTPLLAVLFILTALCSLSQSVAINTDSSVAHPSALLDIKNDAKGILIPRVNLAGITDISTIASPAVSLLVYNLNAALPNGTGFYTWTGTEWEKLTTTNSAGGITWALSGNAGASFPTNFIGTRDSVPLSFRMNNLRAGLVTKTNTWFGHVAGNRPAGINGTVAIGDSALHNNNSGIGHNTAVGSHAGLKTISGRANSFIGYKSGYSNTAGDNNVAVGNSALQSSTTGNYSVAVGDSSMANYTGRRGMQTAVGSGAMYSLTTGERNTAIGYKAMHDNVAGVANVAVGNAALYKHIGNAGVAVGDSCLYNNIDGYNNTGVGTTALFSNIVGLNNTAIGYTALRANTGSRNTAIGSGTMAKNVQSYHNTAVGGGALMENVTGDDNTALGMDALNFNTTGNNNTAIGIYADVLLNNLNNATVIGANASISSSNAMSFGNASVTRWAFGLFSTGVGKAIEVGSTNLNGNGAFLTSGGTWTNTSSIDKKEDFTTINSVDLLEKLAQLSITKWKYKGTDEFHIGPSSQQFYKLFQLGVDDQGISTVDPAGISLAAIQVLIKENESLKKELADIRKDLLLLSNKIK